MKAKELQELGQWKVGQLVALFHHGSITGLRKITRITDGRKGTIYVSNKTNIVGEIYETAYDSNGNLRTPDRWSNCSISPATEAHIKTIKISKAYNFLQSFNWQTLSPDQAIQIAETIKGFTKPLDKPA
jgi:hypothetical protein